MDQYVGLDVSQDETREVSDSKCNTFLFNIETERKSRWKQRDTDTYVRANGT